jgi:hypothetical protein
MFMAVCLLGALQVFLFDRAIVGDVLRGPDKVTLLLAAAALNLAGVRTSRPWRRVAYRGWRDHGHIGLVWTVIAPIFAAVLIVLCIRDAHRRSPGWL